MGYRSIYSYIYYIVKDRELTEDIFQETFVKVITTIKQGRYVETGKFPSWISRIAHNLIIDYYRQYVILEVADLINMIDDQDIVKRILEISSLHLPQLESNQAIDDYIKIIQEKLKIERIKQLEQELSQTYDPRQQAKILQEIIESKDKE